MKWTRWLTMWTLLCGAFAGVCAKDDPAAESTATNETPPSDENAEEAPAEEPFKVSLTDKWSVLVNPVKPRKGVVELTQKSPIQNVGEFTFTGPMVGHPFGLGDFAADGRWALVDGVARPVDGSNALIHLAGADQFELEGIIHQEKFGGWLLLLGWNQGHGYSLSNVTLKESGSPWFICEYRGDKAIESTNNEVKHFEWRNDQPLQIGLRDKKLTVIVGKTAIVEDYLLENYTPGDLFLGTYDTRYGPKPIAIRSLRIRAAVDESTKTSKPAKGDQQSPKTKSKKSPSKSKGKSSDEGNE